LPPVYSACLTSTLACPVRIVDFTISGGSTVLRNAAFRILRNATERSAFIQWLTAAMAQSTASSRNDSAGTNGATIAVIEEQPGISEQVTGSKRSRWERHCVIF
jgi:hypothetical protein